MDAEVRYHMCRPAQARARREQCPVAYIPIGTIEWHGPQNPLGADTLQAEGLAMMCAKEGGGLVFPPLWYGESRSESLMEANADDREEIALAMGLPPDNFLPERQPFSPTEQTLGYQRLLLHILAEAETLGFKLGVLVAGHYPLIDHACSAALLFNQRHYSRHQGMLAWACVDYLLVRDRYPDSGDHAAGWETSHLMALHPETVDLSSLPPKGQRLTGIMMGTRAPQDSTAEFGRTTLEAAAEAVLREVSHRLAHPELYTQHGGSLQQNLWKG
ncbi:MAG: creatininase family protein [Spirochaetia bacterium]